MKRVNLRKTGLFFFSTFIVIILIAAAASGFLIHINEKAYRNRVAQTLVSEISYSRGVIEEALTGTLGDLQSISVFHCFSNFLVEPTDENRKILEETFIRYSDIKKIYDQIRLIDPLGKELIRVDYSADGAHAIPEEQLQDKSQRYYFREALKLDPGEVFISRIDLNIENGEIETPWKPMIRFSQPVYSPVGDLAGILIINLKADIFLDKLSHVQDQQNGTLFILVNSSGYYLINSLTPEKTWGFMFGNDFRLQNDFPGDWNSLGERGSGILASNEGLTVFTTIAAGRYNQGEDTEMSLKDWRALFILPRTQLNKSLRLFTLSVSGSAGLIILLTALLMYSLYRSYISTISLTGQLEYQLKSKEEVIDLLQETNSKLQDITGSLKAEKESLYKKRNEYLQKLSRATLQHADTLTYQKQLEDENRHLKDLIQEYKNELSEYFTIIMNTNARIEGFITDQEEKGSKHRDKKYEPLHKNVLK